MHGEQADWGLAEHLTASVVDELRILNYQTLAKRLGKKARQAPKPKLIRRPGMKQPDGTRRFGDAKKTVAEMRVLLDRWKRGE